jgi:RHS repeat-associated protein
VYSEGTAATEYAFTGESYSSSTNMLYLRARFYNPKDGRFFQLDPSKQEKNLYYYASSNPVIFTDPSGLNYINPDYKKILENWVTATKSAYSKDGSNRNCALHPDDGQFPNDTVDDLFTDFICEYGPAHRDFYYDDDVTVELAHSTSLKHLRADFYSKGANYFSGKGQMNPIQFFEAKLLDLINGSTPTRFMGIDNIPVTITDFIGGYDWEVYKTQRNTVNFKIVDQKDLVSGTRINFTRQGAQDISIEEYLQNPQKYNRNPTYEINPIGSFDWSRYNLISILSEKSSIDRNPGKGDVSGGGTMTYTYRWEEKFIENWACNDLYYFYNPDTGPIVVDQLPIPDNQLLPSLNQ